MNLLQTVLGPLSPDELGHCQCHEHIMLRNGTSFQVNPALCMDDISKSLEEVNRYVKAGGTSLIDAQPGGCGRMEQELALISEKTGVSIVASTGFHKKCFYPKGHWLWKRDEQALTEFFIHELCTGMYLDIDRQPPLHHFDKRAGILKAALDADGLDGSRRRLFSAAASAAEKTGVPLMVHIEPRVDAAPLLDFLLRRLRPDKIIFCHMDRKILPWEDYYFYLRQGIFLEFDTIGRFSYHDDEAEILCVRELADHGFLHQLLFSLDTTNRRMKAYTSQAVGLDNILTTFLPLMDKYQFTREERDIITKANCRSLYL